MSETKVSEVVPEWVTEEPESGPEHRFQIADGRDCTYQGVEITRDEYIAIRDQLARMRLATLLRETAQSIETEGTRKRSELVEAWEITETLRRCVGLDDDDEEEAPTEETAEAANATA